MPYITYYKVWILDDKGKPFDEIDIVFYRLHRAYEYISGQDNPHLFAIKKITEEWIK